jgi:sugar lactone lactonase YvrE
MFLVISVLFGIWAGFIRAKDITIKVIASPEFHHQNDGAQSKTSSPPRGGLWIDSNHTIYAPSLNRGIRMFSQAGNLLSVAQSPNAHTAKSPNHVVGDNSNHVLYVNDDQQIWKHDLNLNKTDLFAGTSTSGFAGDGGPAVYSQLNHPCGMWLTSSGELLIADTDNHRIRMIFSDNIIATIAGSIGDKNSITGGYSGDSGLATSSELDSPTSVYADSLGNVYIADYGNHLIRLVDHNQIITTFAGSTASRYYNGDDLAATLTTIDPLDLKGDKNGTLYIADFINNRIRMVDNKRIMSTFLSNQVVPGSIHHPIGLWISGDRSVHFLEQSLSIRQVSTRRNSISTLVTISPNVFMQLMAGSSTQGYGGDGDPSMAPTAQLTARSPWMNTNGVIYIPDGFNRRIRKVDSNGILSTFGGTGNTGNAGLSAPIGSVTFYYPHSIVGDTLNTFLYISDQWYVWKYVFSTNIISVYAHYTLLTQGFSGDNGPGGTAQLCNPAGLWLTTSGVLYIADYGNHRIRKIVTSSGIISTVVGSGCSNGCTGTFTGDNAPATSATLNGPSAVYMDTVGKLFIADAGNNRIRLVDTNSIITTFAGTGSTFYNGEDIPATTAAVGNPTSVKGDTLGYIYIADGIQCIIRIVDAAGIISTIFGNPAQCGFSPGVASRSSVINIPTGIWLSSLTTLYFSDGNSIHRSTFVSTPTSQPSGQPSRQPSSQPSRQPFSRPSGQPSRQPSGQPIGEPTGQPSSQPSIQSVTPIANLFMQLVAGTGVAGVSGNNGPATSSQISVGLPWVDSVGNIYITEGSHFRIRKITTSGIITAFGGTGNQSFAGNGGPISAVSFWWPWSIVADASGTTLYISDVNYVWKYSPATGIVSVFVGSTALGAGFSGDGGPASSARLFGSYGLWLTTTGILYIADSVNHRIRKVASNGIITTVVGQGCSGDGSCAGMYAGDGNPANQANLNKPVGVYVDTTGRLFIADFGNHRIRVVETNNIISTFAGTGDTDPFNDGVPAMSANIFHPVDVKGDSRGNIYIVEQNSCVLRVVGTNELISTLFGSSRTGCGFSSGLSSATSALNALQGVWIDSLSNIYFTDVNSVHRSVVVASPSSQPSGQPSREQSAQPTRQPTRLPSGQPTAKPSIPTSQPSSSPTYPVIDYYPNLFMKLMGGSAAPGFLDGAAVTSLFNSPGFPWVSQATGYLYIPDGGSGKIRRIDANGNSAFYAGSGGPFTGTGGPLASTALGTVRCMVGDSSGFGVYISGQFYIWKFTNSLSLFVGSVALGAGFSGDSGPALSAQLDDPQGLWLTSTGVLFIADSGNNRIRRVSSTGIITTVAGSSGPSRFAGDGGPATAASLNLPCGVFVDSLGNLFIVDQNNYRIRVVNTNNIISTLAGTGLAAPYNGDNIRATLANINSPKDVKGDTLGNIYFTESNTCIIRMISKTSGNVTTRFGTPNTCGFTSGTSHHASSLQKPVGLWLDSSSIMYITDQHSIHRSFVVSSPTSQPSDQPTSRPSGQPTAQPSGPSGQPTRFPTGHPSGQPSRLPSGQPTRQPTRRPSGQPTRFPTGHPSGQPSRLPSGQPTRQPTRRPSGQPTRLPSVQPTGQPTRKPTGQPTRFPSAQPSGQPTRRPSGQPSRLPSVQPTGRPTRGPSSQPSRLPSSQPTSRPSIPTGQPSSGPTIQMNSRSNLFMELVAGTNVTGFSGDNGPATSARIKAILPWVDSVGSLYLPDSVTCRIRKIDSAGIITTFGGTGSLSAAGIGGPIGSVSFGTLWSIVGDTAGSFLYFSDQNYVWKYSFSSNIVSTYVGSANFPPPGFSGDDGPVSAAQMYAVAGLWLTTSGFLYLADAGNHRIRRVNTATNIITTVAGSGCGLCVGSFGGDGGPATSANLKVPRAVYVDTNGKMFIADSENRRIRVVAINGIITTFAGTGLDLVFNGDYVPAIAANLGRPLDVKGDSLGNIYITESGYCFLRVVDINGLISTVFGSSNSCGFSSGITSATNSRINAVVGIWIDSSSNIYFSDSNSVHRSITVSSPTSQPSGQPTRQPTSQPSSSPTYKFIDYFPNTFMKLIGGTGVTGSNGDNGAATSAEFSFPSTPWVDSNGNIFVPESGKIRRIDSTGIVITFGGTGNPAVTGTSGPIASVDFGPVRCIVGDSLGTMLYISAQHNIWKYNFSSGVASVLAGTNTPGYLGDNQPAINAQLNSPQGLWLTTSGDLFIADQNNHRIRKISSTNNITTVAGSTGPPTGGFSGDGGPATSAILRYPCGVFVDTIGKLFIVDRSNYRIRVVDTNNIITTFAGTGFASPFNGDNIPATMANIYVPRDLKGDSLGNIYLTESNSCIIRKITTNGNIFTIFGTPGSCTTASLGVTTHTSTIKYPQGLWLDSDSNLYFTDTNSIHRSLVVSSPSSQPTQQPSRQPTTVPTRQPSSTPNYQIVDYYPNLFMKLLGGIDSIGYDGDNGLATLAVFNNLGFPWVGPTGNVYVPDTGNGRIRRIVTNGIVSTFGGTGGSATLGGGSILSMPLGTVRCVVGSSDGSTLYISADHLIWKYVFSTDIVSVFAGGLSAGYVGDTGVATSAKLNSPLGLWLTTNGFLFIADSGNHRIRKISSAGIITKAAGSSGPTGSAGFTGDGGSAVGSQLNGPSGVYVDSAGKFFIADQNNNRIRVVDTNNIITTFAGSGSALPYNGDSIPAIAANINLPRDVKGDSLGNIYITESGNCVIRKITVIGIITTLFGAAGQCGVSLGITPHASRLLQPQGIWVDSIGNLCFTDFNSIHRSMTVASPSSQPSQQPTSRPSIPTSQPSSSPSYHLIDKDPNLFMELIGGSAEAGFRGDNDLVRLALFNTPGIPWVDSVGSIYIPDINNARIRKVKNGNVTTFGGNGGNIASGVSGPIESTDFGFVRCVMGNTAGTVLYISSVKYIWKYIFATNIVSSLAGTGTPGFNGDNGPSTAAQVNSPLGLWVTTSGVYFAEWGNNRIRRILDGIITTVVGSDGPAGFSGDGGPATSATLSGPWSVFVDTMSRMFISDQINNRIRMVNTNSIISTIAGTGTLSGFNGENIRATLANLIRPKDLKGDSLGNIYIADYSNCIIRKIGVNGNITTIFGTAGQCSMSFDVSPHTSSLQKPLGLWLDSASNLYFTSMHAIYRSFRVSSPTSQPTGQPTRLPSYRPTAFPTGLPTKQPSAQPTLDPTASPTNQPTGRPSYQSTSNPTAQPSSLPSSQPTRWPSSQPTGGPSSQPSTRPTGQPTSRPSKQPTDLPSSQPSTVPSTLPTAVPTSRPTNLPSSLPSGWPTSTPSLFPSVCPTTQPSSDPTERPSGCPSALPSSVPSSVPTAQPSRRPSGQPSSIPSVVPSMVPTGLPSSSPSTLPTVQPTSVPSSVPSKIPSERPTAQPTVFPSVHPTMVPSEQPTTFPTSLPTRQPSGHPSVCPTVVPSSLPSNNPTEGPSSSPSLRPSAQPSGCPSFKPSCRPSSIPSSVPSVIPSFVPTSVPSVAPTVNPSRQPSSQPSSFPSGKPTSIPTHCPSGRPSSQPIALPTTAPRNVPTTQPFSLPTSVPSLQPVAVPSEQPVSYPSSRPSVQPSRPPKAKPSSSPSGQPTSKPTQRTALLTNATFAADGQSFLVKFAVQCITPKLKDGFACDKFFHFPCANVSICHWLNSKTVQVLVPSNDECARPGDKFLISDKTGNPLCSCTPAKDCSKVDMSLRQTLITFPKSPIVPTMIFNLPSVLPSCSGLNLDLSNSVGDLGRSWSRVNVTVTSSSASDLLTDLQRFILKHFNVQVPLLSPPLQIRSNYLKANTELNFTAEICNFLGGCNSNHFTMKIVEGFIPTATILKASSSDMTRVQSLLLLSAIQKTACNTSLNVNDLQYIWTVFRLSKTIPGTKVVESSIKSSSKDPSRFALIPYSLQSNQSYVINLLTKYLDSSSTTSVQIDVKIGNLRAVVQGNSQQAMRVGEVQNLDGSQSYDEDKGNLKGLAAGLKFSWSCSSSAMATDNVCSNIVNATLFQASRQSPILILKANLSAASLLASLTLTISDPLTSRTAAATITMNILPSMYPTIALSSNAISTSSNNNNKINPSQSLQLTANINIPTAGMNGNITWFSTNVDLHAISITSLRQPVSSTFNSNPRLYFALLPNSLTAGKVYTFGLKCQLNGNIQTTSFISIAVNAPPSLGSFVVSPLVGSAYLETFHLTCNRWIDSDLPLSYQFSYLSQTSLTLITKSVTPLSYAATVLPEGLTENNKKVSCQADIYDSLNANSTVYTAVQVNSLFKSNLSALVHFNIDVKNAVDLDDLIKGVNIASSLLNQPNCTLAPNCTQLNRFPCLSTGHTCGPCQISYFSSSTGDGNELCVKQVSDRVITHQRRKECYLNCSSHGDCIYYSQVTGKRIDSCYDGDLSCYSSCSCDIGYKLSNYCEMTDEESKTWISLRDLVVNRIITNVQLQDPSEHVVSGWMNSLLAISQVPNQISEKSLASLLDLSQHALSVVGSNGFSASTALANYLSGMDSLSAVLSILGNIEGRGRRRLEEINSYNQQISGGLKNYSLLISQSMVPGQSPSRIMKSNFKLHIQNLPLEVKASGIKYRKLSAASTACSSTTEVSLPQTLLEKGLKQAPTVMTIPTCAENEPSLQISAISLSFKLFKNDEFTSNALSLSLSSNPCSSNNLNEGCNAEFSMESHNSGAGLLFATENRTVNCVVNDFTNHTVLCPNRKNYSVSCNGKTERIIFHCPSVSLLPSCQGLIGTGVTKEINCERKSFGKEIITCVCPLSPSSVSHSSSSSATTDISIVALLTSVETTFVSTLLSAEDLSATSLAKSWEAIVTVGVFLATIIGFMCFSVYADDQVHKKVSIEEKMMEHAKVHSVYQQKLLIQSRKDNSNNQDIDLFKMAEEALPGILSCPSLNQRIWNEEKKFHRWLGIIYYFSTVFPRILRVVSLASNIIIMLFIQSLTYNYTHGDDGSCELLTTEKTCLVPRSSYGTGGSKCYWNVVSESSSSSSVVGSCGFIQPENSIEVMLFVATFSGLVSAPLAICVDWIIHNFLSAPNGSSSVDVFPSSHLTKEKKELAIFPAMSPTGNTVMRNSFVKNREGYQIEAEKDYQRLRHELFNYRQTITTEEHRSEIDRLWALSGENQRIHWDDDNNGNKNEKTNRSGGGWILQRLGGLVSRSVVATQSISKSLHQELIQLYDNLEKESIKFKLLKTEKDQSKRLLYLFQKDLVPGITGEILEAKEKRENIVLQPVSMKIKLLAWFFLGVLDLGMLFYVFLFALSQDSHRQAAWGRSLGIYLFLDIVLISTLMVIFMHVLLPSLIMRDVGKIKKKVTESIHEFYEKMDQEKEEKEKEKHMRDLKNDDSDREDDDSFDGKEDHGDYDSLHLTKRKIHNKNKNKKKNNAIFNAAKYLFLSYRMAEQFPDLKASQIILHYSSPWPKQDYKHIKELKNNYSDKYSGITRAISIIVIFFLTNLLATPLAIQDMILQICTTAAIGYTMLIHIQLYYIYPALVIIPTLAVVALVFVVKYYWKDDEKEEQQKNEQNEAMLAPVVANNNVEVLPTVRSASVSVVLPPPMTVTTRRQSLQYGLQLASELKNKMMSQEEEEKESEDREEESESEEEEKFPDECNDYQDHNQKQRNYKEESESEGLKIKMMSQSEEKEMNEDKEAESAKDQLHDKHNQNRDLEGNEEENEESETESAKTMSQKELEQRDEADESESEESHHVHHQNHDHDQESDEEEEISSESHSHSSEEKEEESRDQDDEEDNDDDIDIDELFSDSTVTSGNHNHDHRLTGNGHEDKYHHNNDDTVAVTDENNNDSYSSSPVGLRAVPPFNYDSSSYQPNSHFYDETKKENEQDHDKFTIPSNLLLRLPEATATMAAVLPSQMLLSGYDDDINDENDDDDFVLSSLESSQNGEEEDK